MPLPSELDEFETVDWTSAFTESGLTRHQQAIAARALARGLDRAEHADERVVELEAELTKLRTMVAALVDHLAERGGVDMMTLRTKIADALAAPSSRVTRNRTGEAAQLPASVTVTLSPAPVNVSTPARSVTSGELAPLTV